MKHLASTLRITLLLTLLTLSCSLDLHAREWLIKSHSQLSTNKPLHQISEWENEAPNGESRYCDVNRIGLTDGDDDKDKYVEQGGGDSGKPWMSTNNNHLLINRNYLEIKLIDDSGNPIVELGDDDIVVYIKRHFIDEEEHATGLRLVAGNEHTDWDWQFDKKYGNLNSDFSILPENRPDTVGYAYFLYRGQGTKEYSGRIDLGEFREQFDHDVENRTLSYSDANDEYKGETFTGKRYTRLRVYFTANNTKKRIKMPDKVSNSSNRTAKLLAFNIMKLGKNENYSDILIDRFHLVTDYSYKYYYYDFIPTLGIFDPHNRYQKIGNNEYYKNLKDYTKYPEPEEAGSPWIEFTEANSSGFKWNKDEDLLKNLNIQMPVYQQQKYNQDKQISRELFVPGTDVENWRQPAHIQEHILYAIPGDAIALYPYTEIQTKPHSEYAIRFAHWYNYRTGGNSDYLDFLIDPTLVRKSKYFGYYGGSDFTSYTKYDPTPSGDNPTVSSTVLIENVEEYLKFVEEVNSGKSNLNAKINADLDFKDVSVDPIGTKEHPYSGKFDGQGHVISNMHINKPSESYIGMFGCVAGNSVIKNLYINNCCFEGKQYVGIIANAICKENETMHFSNIISNSAIICQETNDDGFAGGLFGYVSGNGNLDNYNIQIKDCAFIGTVSCGKTFGGIGVINKGTVSNCISILKPLNNQDWVHQYGNYFIDSKYGQPNLTDKNLFTNITTDEDKKKENLKTIYTDSSEGLDINAFYILKNNIADPDESLPEKIYVNSADFAKVLGEEWCYVDGSGIVPFTKTYKEQTEKPGEGEDPVINEDFDQVVGLKDLVDKIFVKEDGTVFGPDKDVYSSENHYKVASVGTFFCPRNTDASNMGYLTNLPEDITSPDPDDKDYVIAADFSCIFHAKTNVDENDGDGKIYQPVTTFRHIFRIKDGKNFAEEFSGSPAKNKEYVKRNRRVISSTDNSDGYSDERKNANEFQIRLEHPVPVKYEELKENGTPKKFSAPYAFYYKISDTDYRRVRSCEIEVYRIDNNGIEVKIENNGLFEFHNGSIYDGLGNRTFDRTKYSICGDGGEYYRMIKADTHTEGHYLLRLIGLDINNNPIHVYDPVTGLPSTDDNDRLIVRELEISFLPKEKASLKYLPKYKNELLSEDAVYESKYGKPVTVDFDKYRYLNKNGGEFSVGVNNVDDYMIHLPETSEMTSENAYYKWPLSWDICSYGFPYTVGFNKSATEYSIIDYNYNVYILANNTKVLTFNEGASNIYDVLYYKSKYAIDSQIKNNISTDKKPEMGFFYWVNAASDPGIAARLRLNQLCTGSIIHVSAWLMDTSGKDELCNVAFNFVAVMKTGERKDIHTFVSGYIGSGDWTNVKYEFLPDFNKISEIAAAGEIDHFELELENNSKSSTGADYAIDEINMYVVQPTVTAKQLDPICESEVTSSRVKIRIPLEQMLSTLGIDKGSDLSQTKVFYTFINDTKFKSLLPKSGYEAAFDEAVLKYQYNGKDHETTTFGVLNFESSVLPEYPSSGEPELNTVYLETEGTVKYLTLITEPVNDEYFKPGQEYSIGIIADNTGTLKNPDALDFDILNSCSHVGKFTIESANKTVIKVGGEEIEAMGGVFCLGSSPEITITLNDKNDSSTPLEGGILDWYAGSLEEFQTEKMDNGKTLEEVLAIFRDVYPEKTDINDCPESGDFNSDMVEYLRKLTESRHKDGRKMLILGTKDYNFYPGKLIATATDSINYVTAIPVIKKEWKENESIEICTAPMEVRLKVSGNSPSMFHGIDIDYPEEIVDVPIRMGLKHILAAQGKSNTLRVPILEVSSPSELSDKIVLKNNLDGEPVYLVETNDQRYPALLNETDENEIFPMVGQIVHMDANDTDEGYIAENAFYVKFDEGMFEFREGYYYTMKFDIVEGGLPGFESNACPGQHIFTIKVVPEYLVWNVESSIAGISANDREDKSLNWNNDANWSRVSAVDLLIDGSATADYIKEPASATDFINRHTYSGEDENHSNLNRDAYAPLEFTKVIIGSGKDFPRLYHIEDQRVEGTDNPEKHLWSKLPDMANPEESFSNNNEPSNDAGNPTRNIHYDMVAYTDDIPAGKFTQPDGIGVAVSCRPWRANTTAEVHFRANSEIYAQQHLRYQKAWVEMEMAKDKWYTVSSPLQSVYAGDMYLPTKGARQITPLFSDINFDNSLELNNRFNPAVYQRSWNLGKDIIYKVDGNSMDGFVALDWSNVYNDVKVAYRPAEGFSIKTDTPDKTDTSEATDVAENRNVLFRLPKADTEYRYFTYEGEYKDLKQKVDTVDKKENHGKLNPVNGTITISANGTSQFFLAGNPFMAHIDMRRFLEANKDKIEQKYWILNSNRQSVTIIDDYGVAIGSDGKQEDTLLPPFAGFFVKSKDKTEELELTYDEGMMVVNPINTEITTPWLDPAPDSGNTDTRSGAVPGILKITALRNGEPLNSALLIVNGDYDPAVVAAEDAETVIDPNLEAPATVYTVASGSALSINALPDPVGTEIGLATSGEETITLRFEGEGCDMGYSIIDKATGESGRLYEGMEYKVTGPLHSRLFISDGLEETIGEAITITCDSEGMVTVTSLRDLPLDVVAYDTPGRIIRQFTKERTPVRFRPAQGVIIIKASDGSNNVSKKVVI